MSTKASAEIPIDENGLAAHTGLATSFVKVVSYKPMKRLAATSDVTAAEGKTSFTWKEVGGVVPTEEKFSLLDTIKTIGKDGDILPEDVAVALNAIRQGLRVGLYLAGLYADASGLSDLKRRIGPNKLSQSEEADFRAKQTTEGGIAAFSVASYILWRLKRYRQEEQAKTAVAFHGIPDLHLTNSVDAIKCFLYYLAGYLDSGKVQTTLEMLKMIVTYCDAYATSIHARAGSFAAVEPFSSRNYRLVDTAFTVVGFELVNRAEAESVVFREVKFEEIVGNQEAKHKMRRLLRDLLSYDFATKMNPMVKKFGCFQPVRMGAGKPGTGKTMLIAAAGTELRLRAKHLGIPLLIHPAPDTLISTYQGGSGERASEWFLPFQDPTRLVYMPMDEAETFLQDRERQGVSAGVHEIVTVFLRNTEGAQAVIRGNAVIEIYTNLPDILDPAVLSRVSDRMEIAGAQSVEDVIDQNWLWFRKLDEALPGFINLKKPSHYERMSAQRKRASLSEIIEEGGALIAKDDYLREAIEVVGRTHKPDEESFYATLFFKLRERYPFITSRDLRNIQRGVDVRLNDFDFPDEWYDDADTFIRQPYAAKEGMLGELVKGVLGKKTFSDVLYEETLKYYDTSLALVRRGELRRIQELVEDMRRHEKAREQFAGK